MLHCDKPLRESEYRFEGTAQRVADSVSAARARRGEWAPEGERKADGQVCETEKALRQQRPAYDGARCIFMAARRTR